MESLRVPSSHLFSLDNDHSDDDGHVSASVPLESPRETWPVTTSVSPSQSLPSHERTPLSSLQRFHPHPLKKSAVALLAAPSRVLASHLLLPTHLKSSPVQCGVASPVRGLTPRSAPSLGRRCMWHPSPELGASNHLTSETPAESGNVQDKTSHISEVQLPSAGWQLDMDLDLALDPERTEL
ncbi:hypothetical protein CKAH01_16085 [Colletotrichum kahawae]|uniref:Uncharacterized protein n=1 Tax=Colletotrichum kahawae TaxID=34407 RepID=A0AAD9YGL6_COLKA|nr:hypothetical protein CKAH01_16085 [Colletotrichum kahawae]